eukprot:Amastigsp_a177795_45.p2 type:complete len:103 gc:universal Amastigsp_a177795_45:364-56(-)
MMMGVLVELVHGRLECARAEGWRRNLSSVAVCCTVVRARAPAEARGAREPGVSTHGGPRRRGEAVSERASLASAGRGSNGAVSSFECFGENAAGMAVGFLIR